MNIKQENRTIEQLKKHYEIEKKLADRLKNSNREERKYLYTQVYDELFKNVTDHPQLHRKSDTKTKGEFVTSILGMLHPFLNKSVTFLEIGPGDLSLSLEVSKLVYKVLAVDVSNEITKSKNLPSNYELIISDGSSIEVEPNTIDIAFSYQLMEHLHPEDAMCQLKKIYASLVKGGIYICITPHRYTGPHDVSYHFDEVATCFHLKEYTYADLYHMFDAAGFKEVKSFFGMKNVYFNLPLQLFIFFEKIFNLIRAQPIKKVLSQTKIAQLLLGIKIIAIK